MYYSSIPIQPPFSFRNSILIPKFSERKLYILGNHKMSVVLKKCYLNDFFFLFFVQFFIKSLIYDKKSIYATNLSFYRINM